MSAFSDRALAALALFNGRLSAYVEQVTSTVPDPPRLPRKALNELLTIADRARSAADAIIQSLAIIDQTALDIVDMQVRLQGETARLASALGELGEAIERQHFVRERFAEALVALDEAAMMVGATVFPSAVEGLREVNVKLWDFEKLQWKRYTEILSDAVRHGTITSEQQVVIQSIADDVAQAFAAVNTLLNDLAETRAVSAAALRRRLEQAPRKLTAALGAAETRMKQSRGAFAAFSPVINASGKVADDVARLLRKLTIPVFPAHERLGACCDYIDAPLYEGLSGVQAFALLNILARLESIKTGRKRLLEGCGVRVTNVFPDRIYFEADRAVIDAVARDPEFAPAPAALHKFNEGSFKQRTFKRGNLQLSYATRRGNRVMVDADIDLYRDAIPHLFGEVLVNHLTGSNTDQYAVWRILDDQSVVPIGGFQLLHV